MNLKWNICLVGIFVGALTAQAQDLFVTPEEKTEKIESSVVFTCSLPPENYGDEGNLRWYRNDVEITTTGGTRVYIEKDGRDTIKLYISNIQRSDAGKYTCRAVLEGNQVTKEVTLNLFKDITFDNAPVSQNPVEGTDGLIMCVVSGSPTPTVTWRFRGMKIHAGGRYNPDSDYGLRIKNVSEAEDEGEYECRAEVAVEGRVKSRKIRVVVHKLPKITQELGTKTQIEFQEGAIECKAVGKPDPVYEFWRYDPETKTKTIVNNIDLPDRKREVISTSGALLFRPVTRGDNGTYICSAINSAGQANSTGLLSVIIPPKVLEYRNVTQAETLEISITCKSEGNPSPEMSFRKVTNEYDYKNGENEGGRIMVTQVKSGEQRLTIKDLKPSDSANYTCKSRNTGGFAEQNGTIIVEFAPRFIEDQRTEFYGWSGKTRNLTCQTIAEPEPTIEWYHFGLKIEPNETYRIVPLKKNSVLQITPPAAEHKWVYDSPYQCVARNNRGENRLEMNFKQADVPDKPLDVEIVTESPTMLELSVTPPENDGGVPVVRYRIDFDTMSTTFTRGDTIRIENMRPSTKYVINVRAQNEVGVSMPFQLVHETMSISKPYKLKLLSEPEGLYPYEYTLTWDKPETGGNSIKEYRFKIRQVSAIETPNGYKAQKPITEWTIRMARDEDMDAPMRSYKLSGLKPNSFYQIQVEARNDIDWSEPTDEFVFKTYQETSRPVYVTGSASGLHRASLPSLFTFSLLTLSLGFYHYFLSFINQVVLLHAL